MADALASSNPSHVTQWRGRRQQRGFERAEGEVWKDDAAPMPDVAAALADPEQESETRSTLYEMIAAQ
ncbi:MAG: hypothetical protein OXH76_23210 [Boseongicola sp.]|nr:hypothetical protein [Boseongicola sp.]